MTQNIKTGDTNAAHCGIPFTSISSADLQARLTGALTFTTRIIKSDQSSSAGSGTYTEPDATNAPGVRRYIPSAADTNTSGPGFLRISATGMEPREIPFLVIPYDPYTSPGVRGGVAYFPILNGENVSAKRSIPFTCVSAADLQTRLDASALTFTARIINANGTSVAGAGTVVQPDATNARGCCFYVSSVGELNVNGDAVIRISGSGGGNTMEPREIQVTVLPFDPYANPFSGVPAVSVSTTDAIRDQVISLVEALAVDGKPTLLRYRNEGKGNFTNWAASNAAGCRRRFQARDVGNDEPPPVSNMVVSERVLELQVTVAYPQDSRNGRDNALDRDDAIDADWKLIDAAIGINGAGNFSGSNNCTPLGCTKTVDRVGDVDFLTIKAQFRFWQSTT